MKRFHFYGPPRLVTAVVILAMALGSCSSSQLVNMWKDPQYPAQPIATALVIALKQDPAKRRIWEDAFVAELSSAGVRATPSYRDFASALPDTQQVIALVKRDGYSGVMTIVSMGSETQQTYVPGYVTTMPVTYYGQWTGYYGTYYQNVYRPGYTTTDEIVRQRIDVWSIDAGGTLVWTATTETMNPTSGDQIRKEVTKLVIPELEKRGVIAKK